MKLYSRVLNIVLGVVLVPAAVGLSLYQLNKNHFFEVKNIDVVVRTQSEPASANVQSSALQKPWLDPQVATLKTQIETYKGVSLWGMNLSKMADLIKSQKWIESSHVSKLWPNGVRVEISPYEVKFLFLSRGQRLVPVIKTGEMLDVIESNQAPDVPLLVGENFFQDEKLRKRALQILAQIPAEGPFSRRAISEFHYEPKNGFWVLLAKDAIRVNLGEEQIELKSARVGQVLEYSVSHGLEMRVIDANLSKKVLVKLRSQP